MKRQISVISKIKHKNYCFLPLSFNSENFSPLSKITSCQICFPELKIAAANYPIILTKKDKKNFKTEVLFSFIKNKNPFINPSGKWLGGYIPAQLRCIPFTLVQNEKKTDKFLSFLTESEFVFDKKNENCIPFFKDDLLSNELSQIMKTIDQIDKSSIELDNALKLISDLDLIVEWPINIKFKDGEKKIEGMYKIDSEKIQNLSENDVFKLHKYRGFEIIYSQLISMAKVDNIVNIIKSENLSSNQAKSLREVVIEKQKIEKDREIDDLVKNLISPD